MSTDDRELVAVPDAEATTDPHSIRYRLGLRNKTESASFTLGETGPNGQTFPWVYVQGEGAIYEIDMLDGEITVTTRPNDQVQAVVYKIDVDQMTGQKITAGQPVRIVFAYDDLYVDETTPIDKWVATTGPRYIEELNARLGRQDDIVVDLQSDVEDAKTAERFGNASRAPRSAEPINGARKIDQEPPTVVVAATSAGMVDLTSASPEAPNSEPEQAEVDLDEIIGQDPEAVQIPDPSTGINYVGRRWRRGQRTTFRHLKDASYRVAILVLHSGESATVVLQHPKGLPAIQLTTKNGVVRQYLAESAWDQVIDPGTPLTLPVSEPMDGDRPIPRGFIPMTIVDEVAATGPQAKTDLTYPKSNSLARFRNREHELVHGRPLSRNLVA